MSLTGLMAILALWSVVATNQISPEEQNGAKMARYLLECMKKDPQTCPLRCMFTRSRQASPTLEMHQLEVASWLLSLPLVSADSIVLDQDPIELTYDSNYEKEGYIDQVAYASSFFRIDFESHFNVLHAHIRDHVILLKSFTINWMNYFYKLPKIQIRAQSPFVTPMYEWLGITLYPVNYQGYKSSGQLAHFYLYFYLCRPLFYLKARYYFNRRNPLAAKGIVMKLERFKRLFPGKVTLIGIAEYRNYLEKLFSLGRFFYNRGFKKNVTLPYLLIPSYMNLGAYQWPHLPVELVNVQDSEFDHFISSCKNKSIEVAIEKYIQRIYKLEPLRCIRLDAFYLLQVSPFASFSVANLLAPQHRKRLTLAPWRFQVFSIIEYLHWDFEPFRTVRSVLIGLLLGIGILVIICPPLMQQ
ncbi:hypothetical protein BdWA1_001015 [Babesia duncani]|uniref:Uncharacterized protein n=1 Tax=Babesia duncani TaxID=323732 RepID=A0AAD9UQK8_9APIC|nr:hypothetical protein BdWA1_001015 [Babesia duncani]